MCKVQFGRWLQINNVRLVSYATFILNNPTAFERCGEDPMVFTFPYVLESGLVLQACKARGICGLAFLYRVHDNEISLFRVWELMN